jgi:chromosome segregation ATPase
MAYELTNQEKSNIIVEHLKTLETNKFDLQASLIECQASTESQQENIDSLTFQIYEINVKQNALAKELASLNTEMGNI